MEQSGSAPCVRMLPEAGWCRLLCPSHRLLITCCAGRRVPRAQRGRLPAGRAGAARGVGGAQRRRVRRAGGAGRRRRWGIFRVFRGLGFFQGLYELFPGARQRLLLTCCSRRTDPQPMLRRQASATRTTWTCCCWPRWGCARGGWRVRRVRRAGGAGRRRRWGIFRVFRGLGFFQGLHERVPWSTSEAPADLLRPTH